jgi:hypothetical protein
MEIFKPSTKRSPNSALVKSPYIKVKVEFKKLSSKIENIDLLNTFAIIKLGNQEKKTNIIRHVSSPRWLDEYEFKVENYKDDLLEIEIYSTKIYSTADAKIVGFQIIPVKLLEQNNLVGEKQTLAFRLILSSPQEFFNEDPENYSHIKKHDPFKYKVDYKETNISSNKENQIKANECPILILNFEYMNFYHLWKCNINIHSIIQENDAKNNNYYFYKLFIKRNDGLQWFKEVTFEEIEEFRKFLLKYIDDLKNIPFPKKSVFRYIPFINKYYSDDNPDILIERKFFLDNFFDQISKNFQIYKFEEFNRFFSSE